MTESLTGECRAILRRLSDYLDGELDTRACEAIEAHCAACPSCAAVVEGLRDTVGLCRQAAGTPIPDGVRARARASVERLLSTTDARQD